MILICIPVICNSHVLSECVDPLLNKRGVDILLLDNGADDDVKEKLVFYDKYPNVLIRSNAENVYVTAAWNGFISYFLNTAYDRLIIMNSDLTLGRNWKKVLDKYWEIYPEAVFIPTISRDKLECFDNYLPTTDKITVLEDGKNIAGHFITLNKKQADQVYPIPDQIRVWFNDNWIFEILTAAHNKMIILDDLKAFHHVSTSVKTVPGIHAIIEQDKIEWIKLQDSMKARIESIKANL